MRIITALLGLILWTAVFSVGAGGAEPGQSSVTVLKNKQNNTEKSKEEACDCCKKCMAAKKPAGLEKETPPVSDGCRDCCDYCGKEQKLIPEKILPEILEKR